jgi:hypothetical protein
MSGRTVTVYQLVVSTDKGPCEDLWYEHISDAEMMQVHKRDRGYYASVTPHQVELSKEGVCQALWEYPVRNLYPTIQR